MAKMSGGVAGTVCLLLMLILLVAMQEDMLFYLWKFVPARITFPILLTTNAEKESFDAPLEKVV